MVADVQLYEGKSLDTVNQAESLGSYGSEIVADYQLYTAANVMVEIADRLTDTEPAPQQYLLLVGGLRSLSRGEHPATLTLNSYLLRALSIAGWAPSFDSCAKCGTVGRHEHFVVQLGGVVCSGCAPTGAVGIDGGTVEVLDALVRGDWDRAEAADPKSWSRADRLVSAYTQWHLERGLKSLEHVAR